MLKRETTFFVVIRTSVELVRAVRTEHILADHVGHKAHFITHLVPVRQVLPCTAKFVVFSTLLFHVCQTLFRSQPFRIDIQQMLPDHLTQGRFHATVIDGGPQVPRPHKATVGVQEGVEFAVSERRSRRPHRFVRGVRADV